MSEPTVRSISRSNPRFKQAILEGLAQFAAIHPRSAAAGSLDKVLEGYLIALDGLTPVSIELAVPDLLRTVDWFPKPSEWVRAAKAKARELADAASFALVAQAQPQARDAGRTPTPERLAAHVAMCALAWQFGPRLEGIVEADPEHVDVWQQAWDQYTSSTEAADDFPTYDQLRTWLADRGADVTLLERARRRSGAVLREVGVGVPPTSRPERVR